MAHLSSALATEPFRLYYIERSSLGFGRIVVKLTPYRLGDGVEYTFTETLAEYTTRREKPQFTGVKTLIAECRGCESYQLRQGKKTLEIFFPVSNASQAAVLRDAAEKLRRRLEAITAIRDEQYYKKPDGEIGSRLCL